MSKGSWYRPVDKKKYDENYQRIFNKCDVCGGKGYLEDKDRHRKIIKTTCIVCSGIGYVEK
jgi:uncharacterized membrane protein